MSKGSFLVVFYGNENYLLVALFSWHSNANLIIVHHNYGIRVCLCLISKTYITSSCSPAQPDPVPNRYAGNGSGDMAIPNLFCRTYITAVNYRQQITGNSPPQPQIEIPVHISHPFQSQVQQIMANLWQEFRYKGSGALTTSTFLQNKFGMAMSPHPPRTLRATWVWLCQTTTASS